MLFAIYYSGKFFMMIAKARKNITITLCEHQYIHFFQPKASHVCSVNLITAKEVSQIGGLIKTHVLSGNKKTAVGEIQNRKSVPI